MSAVFYEARSTCLINRDKYTQAVQSAKTSIMYIWTHKNRNIVKKWKKRTIPSHISTSQCFPVAADITFGKQNKVRKASLLSITWPFQATSVL